MLITYIAGDERYIQSQSFQISYSLSKKNLYSLDILCRALPSYFYSIFDPALNSVVTALTCDCQTSERFQTMISVMCLKFNFG